MSIQTKKEHLYEKGLPTGYTSKTDRKLRARYNDLLLKVTGSFLLPYQAGKKGQSDDVNTSTRGTSGGLGRGRGRGRGRGGRGRGRGAIQAAVSTSQTIMDCKYAGWQGSSMLLGSFH